MVDGAAIILLLLFIRIMDLIKWILLQDFIEHNVEFIGVARYFLFHHICHTPLITIICIVWWRTSPSTQFQTCINCQQKRINHKDSYIYRMKVLPAVCERTHALNLFLEVFNLSFTYFSIMIIIFLLCSSSQFLATLLNKFSEYKGFQIKML